MFNPAIATSPTPPSVPLSPPPRLESALARVQLRQTTAQPVVPQSAPLEEASFSLVCRKKDIPLMYRPEHQEEYQRLCFEATELLDALTKKSCMGQVRSMISTMIFGQPQEDEDNYKQLEAVLGELKRMGDTIQVYKTYAEVARNSTDPFSRLAVRYLTAEVAAKSEASNIALARLWGLHLVDNISYASEALLTLGYRKGRTAPAPTL